MSMQNVMISESTLLEHARKRAGHQEKINGTSQAERTRLQMGIHSKDMQSTPDRDQYVSGEKPEPTGMYRVAEDEEGQRQVIFDALADEKEKPENAPETGREPKAAEDKEGAAPKKAETCKGSTDKVDNEIEKLKRKKSELEQQIAQAKDNPDQQAKLEKQLAQVENELRIKDTDSYRRQHSQFTSS